MPSWGQQRQKWNLSPTMTAELSSNGWLIISSTADSEAMPNFTRENPGPWKSINRNFGVRIVDNITSIGNYAFAGCEYVTSVQFDLTPDANAPKVGGFIVVENSNFLLSIGEGAFEGCTFKDFSFPKSLTSIGNYAFKDCKNLKFLHFPVSLTSIGNGAFHGSGLSAIWVEWKTPLIISDNAFASFNTSDISLYVPKGTKSRYKKANVWKNFDIETSPSFESYKDNPIIGEKPIAILVLLLSIVLFFMRITKRKDELRQGTAYLVSNSVFLSVCALEILFVITTELFGIPWFCDPNRVGWLWTVINFIIMGGVVFNQILYLFDVISDVFENGNAGCDLRWGLYSWVGGLVCLFICGFFFQEGLLFVLLIVGLIQIVQSIFIFRSYKENIKGAFLGISVYLLGTTATVLTLTTFLVMLIIVVIGGAILWLIMKLTGMSDSSSSSGKKGRFHYSDGTSEEATGEKGVLGETYWTGKDSGNQHTTSF